MVAGKKDDLTFSGVSERNLRDETPAQGPKLRWVKTTRMYSKEEPGHQKSRSNQIWEFAAGAHRPNGGAGSSPARD
ncbi:hypothetical protein RND71_040520 [Anisodus tanguticus]|uniref:Uncharacterized protein n=1 Tax=Anisodus tanguticus TaxID=243964 RepID=A0AAE1QT23_9SOLA|nr:hypothetical protein RND71_040520 [Anisodus tanguticus]